MRSDRFGPRTRPGEEASDRGVLPFARVVAVPPPQLLPAEAPRSNLPLQLTSFIGRDAETAEVMRLLGGTRLVTLVGAGGVGKTRLAQEVAARVLPTFPHGVWHVELAPLTDPNLVSHTVAAALGVREQPGRSTIENLEAVLGPRELLLVLDNCEHLASACAALCRELLQAVPGLRILATSRQALGTWGETTWYVPSMQVAGSGSSSQPTEALQLFAERAAATRSPFALTSRSAPLVEEICRRLDGIPLAIELAAARVKVLSLEQIAARLDDRFRLLTSSSPELLPRHQTLRALVDWSYELLGAPERTLFQHLAVFAGGCSLEAIEAICTDDNLAPDAVLDVLTQLVDRSLVIPEEVDGSMRYRLLETMRAYGQERLRESGEGEAIRDRHLAWFRDLAVRAEVDFMGPNEEALLALQQREESNFRAALEWSRVAAIAADPERLESGLLLAGSLWRFWDMQGRLGEGRAQLTELLALPGAERPTRGRAKALFAAGYGAFYQGGDLNAAAGLWEEGVRIARSFGPAHEVSLCLWSLTVVSVSRGELDAAESYLAEQEAVSGAIGFALGSSIPIFWRGQIALLRGDRANGVARIRESLEFIQGHGDRWYAGTVMIPLGQLALADGELEAARVWFCRAVEIMSAFRDIHWMSVALLGLAWIASEQGEAERAARIMGGVEALCDAVGMPMVDLFFQASHERAIELARGQLGEAAFAAFWAAGRTVPFADFVADALGTGQPSSSDDVSARETAPAGTTLSPREGEVAALIARGLTNQQIAETLVISPLTAITHVRNIMRKLGVTSRAQVAAWVATNHGVGPQSSTDWK